MAKQSKSRIGERMSEVGFKDRIAPILEKMPAVERPVGHVHFKRKLIWTLAILLLYFALSNVPVFGLSKDSIDLFEQYRAFFAGATGSIMLLGIGPIVTASIVLQLLKGADIIKLDTSDPKDQAIYQNGQKALVFVMIALETLPQITGGFLKPSPELASSLGVPLGTITALIFLQICLGGVLILFMDEIVSKWGIGSGVGLFIIAGIAQSIVTGIFNWELDSYSMPIGILPKWFYMATEMGAGQLLTGSGIMFTLVQGGVLAVISTIGIFLVVTYVESTRIEIPLAHAGVRGARGRFPVKLIYASVLPMILVRALQANVQMIGLVLWNSNMPLLGHNRYIGEFIGNEPVSGMMFYTQPIRGPIDWVPSMVVQNFQAMGLTPPAPWQLGMHILLDAVFLILGGILFAIFWIETTGMGAKSVARQIARSGMQIPGFRRDPGVLERVLDRYIPQVTVIGGAFIGALTLIASLLGTIGNTSGTGLLLAVSITYRLYEQLANEQIMEMHPLMRKFIGET